MGLCHAMNEDKYNLPSLQLYLYTFETVVMKCPFAADMFPFDVQTCNLIYRSQNYDHTFVSVRVDEKMMALERAIKNRYQPHSGRGN